MDYKFLFYTPDYEEDFFKNLYQNIVIEQENYIFFIEVNTEDEIKLFWAGTSMDHVAKGLKNLGELFPQGTKITISCGEEKRDSNQLDKILKSFAVNGCELKYHNVGYKTDSLDLVCQYPLVTEAKSCDIVPFFKLVDETLGGGKFDMNTDELSYYIGNNDNKCAFIIKDESTILGLALGEIYNQGKTVFIRGLAVDKRYRGLGYSKQLLAKVFKWAKDNGAHNSMLWVESGNSIARALYHKVGYYAYGDQEAIFSYTVN